MLSAIVIFGCVTIILYKCIVYPTETYSESLNETSVLFAEY